MQGRGFQSFIITPQAMSDSQDTVAFVELEPAELAMIDLHDG